MKISNLKSVLSVFIALNIIGFALITTAQERTESAMNIFLDSDQDGLSDEEELMLGTDPFNPDTDGDGYSDGAEVKSGYDPLRAAPGDRLTPMSSDTPDSRQATATAETPSDPPTDSEGTVATETVSTSDGSAVNITQEITQRITERFGSGDSAGSLTVDDLDEIIQVTLGSRLNPAPLPEISDAEINIKPQNYSHLPQDQRIVREKEDFLEYLTTSLYVIFANSPQKISQPKDLQLLSNRVVAEVQLLSLDLGNISFFQAMSESAQKTLDEMTIIPVPEKMTELHKEGMSIVKYGLQIQNQFKIDPTDPMAMLGVLSDIETFMLELNNFQIRAMGEFSQFGIDVAQIPLAL